MKVMFFVTDCRSLNELCEGQFEFYHERHPDAELLFLAGSNPAHEAIFRKRGVGRLLTLSLKRLPALSDFVGIYQTFQLFRQERPDAVVCSTPKAFVFGSICARLTGVKRRIGIVRGFRQENMRGIKRVIFSRLDAFAMRCCTHIIYISQSLREVYEDELGKDVRALCIASSNGLPTSKYHKTSITYGARMDLRSGLGFRPKDLVCIIVGRICHDKGIVEIDNLLDKLPTDTDVRLMFVGSADDAYGEAFVSKRASDLRVVFAGEHRSLSDLYSAADIHLFLSHREGFGNVAIEAAVNGVPTIAYDVTGVRDSVRAGVSGIKLSKGDVVGVMEQINAIRTARARREKLFLGARDWALDNFEQNHVWSKYAGVIFDFEASTQNAEILPPMTEKP